jgi:hypothetical protein
MEELLLEYSTEEFKFIRARKVKTLEEVKYYFSQMTERPQNFDFGRNAWNIKDEETQIRRQGKEIETIGGLKGWIVPIKENNRTKAYYVIAMEVSKKWLDNEDNNSYTFWKDKRSWCGIKNWPEFSLQDTIEKLDRKIAYDRLNEKLIKNQSTIKQNKPKL